MPDIRPDLSGLDEQQKTLALAHWWLWCTTAEHMTGIDWPATGCTAETILHALEAAMTGETKHRLALARGRYWRERNTEG